MPPRVMSKPGTQLLHRDFYDRSTLEVAKDLLGCLLVHEVDGKTLVGRIVETEAYDGFDDRASHASRRKTPRNEVMFQEPGHAYVYLIYGMHHCLNFVTREEGYPAAVLIRALEPVAGIDVSTRGPGRLTRAMGIDRSHDRVDITRPPLYVAPRDMSEPRIGCSARIGVAYAGEWASAPLRFFVKDCGWVSGPRSPGRQ